MTDSEKLARIRAMVEKIAANQTSYERDEEYYPGQSGNYDDAYSEGQNDGAIYTAREIMATLGARSSGLTFASASV